MKINISHGNGGKETSALINNIFKKHFSNPVLNKMQDSAVVNVTEKIAFTTDSFIIKPVFFNGGDIGRLAVSGTVNDLLMSGSIPKYITAGFIIEEGFLLGDLEKIAISMKEAAKEAKVKIVAGDTKVTDGNGGIYINTSGIGIFQKTPLNPSRIKDGDVILVSGSLGDHHACIMSHRMGIENNITSDVAPLVNTVSKLTKVNFMRDITRGGLATVLNEIADFCKLGIYIDEKSIPVSDEVIGFCDILGLDPLYMANEGKFLCVVPQKYATQELSKIRKTKYGKNAVIIGKITSEKRGVFLNTRLGGVRKLGLQIGEGLPRIC